MAPRKGAFDPEVEALVHQVRAIVGEAYRLSRDIDSAMNELGEYVGQPVPTEDEDADA